MHPPTIQLDPELISLFDSVGKAFSGHKKEKVSKNADFLCRVGSTGEMSNLIFEGLAKIYEVARKLNL